MFVKAIMIILMALFYACYFAKMISQKRQGIATDQLGKDKEGFPSPICVAARCI